MKSMAYRYSRQYRAEQFRPVGEGNLNLNDAGAPPKHPHVEPRDDPQPRLPGSDAGFLRDPGPGQAGVQNHVTAMDTNLFEKTHQRSAALMRLGAEQVEKNCLNREGHCMRLYLRAERAMTAQHRHCVARHLHGWSYPCLECEFQPLAQ